MKKEGMTLNICTTTSIVIFSLYLQQQQLAACTHFLLQQGDTLSW
jgi:hypothetical protein